MNFNKLTIKENKVYRLKSLWSDSNLGGGNKLSYFLPAYATPQFSGNHKECLEFIMQSGGEYRELA